MAAVNLHQPSLRLGCAFITVNICPGLGDSRCQAAPVTFELGVCVRSDKCMPRAQRWQVWFASSHCRTRGGRSSLQMPASGLAAAAVKPQHPLPSSGQVFAAANACLRCMGGCCNLAVVAAELGVGVHCSEHPPQAREGHCDSKHPGCSLPRACTPSPRRVACTVLSKPWSPPPWRTWLYMYSGLGTTALE